jgi:hypothetical protein
MASTHRTATADEQIVIDYDSVAASMLTPELDTVIVGALRIMARAAEQAGVHHGYVEADGLVSPDSDRQRIVLTHWVTLDSAQATQLWSNEAEQYYIWIESLPAELAKVAREQVGIAVAWDAPE